MTINFLNNGIKDNSDEFWSEIREKITTLSPNKAVKFKTIKGILSVSFHKSRGVYKLMLDGHEIEELTSAETAIESLTAIYKAL